VASIVKHSAEVLEDSVAIEVFPRERGLPEKLLMPGTEFTLHVLQEKFIQ
jgi:hypothetical protein